AELFKLAVPVKTRHNEVAPSQYEIAPIFEDSNLATDHQMLTMEILRRTADQYGLACLLHEKPFAGINGSGKHNNWSMATDTGENLLNPGETPRDAGDRNRTSPFAFTGNKFEFRAVGASQSIAAPNTVLNTIVAESLDYIATNLEKAVASGQELNRAIQELLPQIIKESKKIIFNGDNYSEEWHKEAERRGLPNLRNTVDALPVILRKDTTELFGKYRVYSERELQSRYTILSETYVKTLNIEGQL